MSFITEDVANQLTAQNSPVMLAAPTLGPYYRAVNYTWTITNFDSYVTYILTSSNGTVLVSGQTVIFTGTSVGPAQFTINTRTITFTISTITNFIATLVGSGTTELGRAVAVDASDNIYVAGNISTLGGGIPVAKYDSEGFIQWQIKIGNSGSSLANGIAVDSSGNIYIVGTVPSSRAYIAKLNNSGVMQWQYYLTAGSYSDVIIDNNGDIIAVGGFAGTVYFHRWDTSGTLLTQRAVYTTFGSNNVYSIVQDITGNYIIGASTSATGNDGYIVIFNASYNFTNDAQVGTANGYVSGIVTDSAGDIYCAINETSAGASSLFIIMKLNTSLVTQWARQLSNVTGAEVCNDIAIDSAGNVYGVGYFNALGTQDILIAKYDSAGVIQWQRQLTATGTQNALSVTINNQGDIVVTGNEANDLLLAVLPSDGSKTGTYIVGGVTFTYSAGTMTAGTSSASSLTVSTSTLTPTSTPVADTQTVTTTTATSNSVPI
jgi:hypothetical protein